MKTIIISDLHNRVDWIEPFLSSISYDRVVFLGDYFDDFNDTLNDAENSAKWLKKSLLKPNRIHLMGTHDMWYRFLNPFLRASGNTEWKYNVINDILTDEDWEKIKFYHFEQSHLMTHAGLHNYIIKNVESINVGIKDIRDGKMSPLFEAGFARRGIQLVGGITWLDWNKEFEPVMFLNQIVGHTEHKIPQERHTENSKNYCIDTKNNHFGILENNKFGIIHR